MLTYNWTNEFPHFSPHEIFSPETWGFFHLLDYTAMKRLQLFRTELGVPLLVNHGSHRLRGVRSCAEQQGLIRKFGKGHAARFSMHIMGKAFDVSASTIKPGELAAKAERFGWGFIKIYSNFVHLDLRDSPDLDDPGISTHLAHPFHDEQHPLKVA